MMPLPIFKPYIEDIELEEIWIETEDYKTSYPN